MTTVAYRDGMICADTGVASASGRCIGSAVKIARNKYGDLAGGAGSLVSVSNFLRWFEAGEKGDWQLCENSQAIIVRHDSLNRVQIYEENGSCVFDDVEYYALGSGGDAALGAMFIGASPWDAVGAAMAHDDGTFGELMIATVGCDAGPVVMTFEEMDAAMVNAVEDATCH